MAVRDLTPREIAALRDVRCFWGPQNTRADVFFGERDEAVLFVKAVDGSELMCVVLTNLAVARQQGTYGEWEYRRHIMGPIGRDFSPLQVRVAYWNLSPARVSSRVAP